MKGNSQAMQDLFALSMIGKDGTFLDIGSCFPIETNNTYLLEQFGWMGLCVDSNPEYGEAYKQSRIATFVCGDATKLDYAELLPKHLLPMKVSYLSLDIDDATQEALGQLLCCGVEFNVATIEHDFYRLGDGPRSYMRKLLKECGYTLIRPDVVCQGLNFEDWWAKV